MKYLRLAICLFAIALFIPSTFAQNKNFRKEILIGLNGGAGLNTVSFRGKNVDSKMTLQPFAGVTFRFVSEKHFGFQTELNYSQRGWTEKYKETNGSYLRTMSYLELPFMMHLYFGRKVRFFINLGPKVAILLGENNKFKNLTTTSAPQYSNASHWVDYSLCGGIGLEWASEFVHIGLDARYNYGLGDIYCNGTKNNFERSAHQNILVGLHILYDVKGKKTTKQTSSELPQQK